MCVYIEILVLSSPSQNLEFLEIERERRKILGRLK